jgi:xanthine dehydrogenase YagS FAD-binding subunit
MKAFEYAAPRTEAEVLSLLSERRGHTEILAGGTDLVGLMKQMLITPDRVVYIDQVDSLKIIERDPDTGGVIIGACAHLDDLLEHALLAEYPAITQAIRGINSMQLQAQGTIGGELCRRPQCWYFRSGNGLLADRGHLVESGDNQFHAILGNAGPAKYVHASRIAPALLALEATLRIAGPAESDENFVLADNFFRTARRDEDRETALGPDQLLTHILLPPAHGLSSATYEVRQSEGPDMPLAAAAALLRIASGVVREAKIVLGQVAPVPWVSTDAARSIVGRPVTEESARAAGAAAVAAATPLSHNAYKVQLTQTAVTRAILLAAGAEPTWL